jgi:iron complex transport system substrate-binding protein
MNPPRLFPTLLALSALVVAGPSRSANAQVRDDEGQLVSLSAPPQRIVSLSPGATAMLFAAGGGDRIVGTPEFSVEPAAAGRIVRIGDSHGFDVERILALHPDLIVAWTGGASEAQLQPFLRARLPVYRHRVVRLDDLPSSIERLGALLHTESKAHQSAGELASRIAAIRARFARAQAPRLLLQVWDRPVYTLGGGQIISEAAEACGYRNVYGELRDAAPAVSLESIAARDPDVILVLASDAATAKQWMDHWQTLPALRAVRNRRVISFIDARLSRMGPEVVSATESLCTTLGGGLEPTP